MIAVTIPVEVQVTPGILEQQAVALVEETEAVPVDADNPNQFISSC